MAVYPCDWSAHRYPGVQRSVYLSVAYPDEVVTHKLRLCERHFHDELQLIREHMCEVDDDSAISTKCEMCEEDRHQAIYAKVYDQKTDPVTFATDLCAEHGALLVLTLKGSLGRLMTGR